MHRRWRDSCPPELVANARDSFVDLSPASDAPADAVKAAWAPLISGQAVPMLGERVGYVEPCEPE